MVKKNTRPVRIDFELEEVIEDIKNKNDMDTRQASKEIAKIVKRMKANKEVVKREIKF